MNVIEYNINGKRIIIRERAEEEVRYNPNTSKPKSKRKGNANLIKMGVGALAVFALAGLATKYSEIDREMCKSEGVEVLESYSPSGGFDVSTRGERKHTAIDVIEKMIEEAKSDMNVFEDNHADEMNFSESRGF